MKKFKYSSIFEPWIEHLLHGCILFFYSHQKFPNKAKFYLKLQSSIRILYMNACPKMCSRHGRRTITPSRKRSIQWNLKWLEKATLVLPILKKQPKRLFLLKLGTLSVLETCKKNDEKKNSALRIHCTTQFLSENDKNEWWEFHLKKKILIFFLTSELL